MPTTGFVLPTARTVNAGSGTWTNDVNILAADGLEATFSLTSKNTDGRQLSAQNFGLDALIPVGATITQVQIRMNYRVNSTAGVADPRIQAYVGGTGVGSIRSGSPLEPTVLTLNTFDITADRAWTRNDLLDGTFEVRVWGRNGSSTSDPSYRWDYAAVEVTYSTGPTEVNVSDNATLTDAVTIAGPGPVREFGGVARVELSPGALASSFLPGAVTIAFIWRPLSVHAGGIFYAANSIGDEVWQHNPFTDGFIWTSSGGGSEATLPYSASDGWILCALTKPAGSLQTIRGHKYSFATGTWQHTNYGTLNDTTNGPVTALHFGQFIKAGEVLDGRLAVIGAWNAVLTDVQLEGLTSALQSWLDLNPLGLWKFDQTSTATAVTDLTGGGANQTNVIGTAVITGDGPLNFSFDLPTNVAANDSATLVDTASVDTGGSSTPISASDTATLTDTAETNTTLSHTDSVTLTESTGALDASLSRVDSGTLSDAASVAQTLSAAVSDSATLTDAALVQQLGGDANLNRTDTLTLTEVVSVAVTVARTDTAMVTDVRTISFEFVQVDSGTLGELVTIAAALAGSASHTLSDVLAVVDTSLIVLPPRPVVSNDIVPVTDVSVTLVYPVDVNAGVDDANVTAHTISIDLEDVDVDF